MSAAVAPTGAPVTDLVSGPLPRAIVRLAVPAIGSALLQLVFLLIDVFWVGRILGSSALAAISTAGFAVWALLAVAVEEYEGAGLGLVVEEAEEGLAGAAGSYTDDLGLAPERPLEGEGVAALARSAPCCSFSRWQPSAFWRPHVSAGRRLLHR